MADLDEGAATGPVSAENNDNDLDDEVQDFRFLSHLSSSKAPSTLPRRGEKDFEPHGTTTQTSVLEASRAAMHEALSQPRHHAPKSHVVGYIDADTGVTTVESTKGAGTHFKTMGQGDRFGRMVLLPEEALYLVERGTLDLRWRGEEGQEGLPLSVQSAYALLVGQSGLTLERFQVFTGLRRLGYVVRRAPIWDGADVRSVPVVETGAGSGEMSGMSWSLWSWIYTLLPRQEDGGLPLGPLVAPGLYRSYGDVYRKLHIIPFHDPEKQEPSDKTYLSHKSDGTGTTGNTSTKLHVCFYVWKPGPDFRKSAPGEPDFRIAVVSARENPFPDLQELDHLLLSTPANPPKADMSLYPKIKHGWRHVILAIVDMGVVSYMRVADAGFGKQRLYETAAVRGNKRGRGRGRGGRGRGRGRGS